MVRFAGLQGASVYLLDGTEIPLIGLGTYGLWDQKDVDVAVDAALSSGYRLFDTANYYRNEKELGNAFKKLLPKHNLKREDIFIVTKANIRSPNVEDNAMAMVEHSIQALQTNYIDLLLVHYPKDWGSSDKNAKNPEHRMRIYRVFEQYKDNGSLRSIGVSNYESRHIDELWDTVKYRPTAHTPLGANSSSLYKDPLIVSTAKKHKATIPQILLAFSYQQGVGIIPKSKNPERISSNVDFLNVNLTQEEVSQLNALNKEKRYSDCDGYALFRLGDESVLQRVDDIWDEFASGENKTDGKLDKTLKRYLKKSITDPMEKLAVDDTQIGKLIKNAMDIKCLHNSAISELMRSIRANVGEFLGDETTQELNAMRLGVAHSIGRYKVKFNPEKIDTMIVQAVSLLDDLDKELNNYVMRCREWYGWHFPELGKLLTDAQAYAKCVKAIGMKQNALAADLSTILPEELAERVRQEAEISMGTDISELDLVHIIELCDQIIELAQYRAQLHEYLKNRMNALAPNLTVLLGELIGARLVSKAGSLMALAKCPASTVQILGAEKALFRALKTKKDTPKYGIIYHAQLVTQSGQKSKGKIARKLAAKVSLSTRVDALCDESLGNQHGIDARAYIEQAIKEADSRGGAKKQRFSGVKQAPKGAYTFKS
uniref:Nop domain-containing protein n=1 Tax=Globodera pallida TaxID=36090 RepID=A0A183BU19_GLOPA